MTTKVMVVEDECIVALNLQRRLVRLGYEVPCVAASHDEAMRCVEETRPDLVLMDINISGDVDGIDTAAKIKIPVIYLTAYSEEKTLQRARATRPYGYLVKPFSERELHATIQMALERRRVELRLMTSEQQLAVAYAQIEEDKRELEIRAARLFEQKERLEVTLNSIGDGVVATDHVGGVSYMNPVAQDMTGWTLEEASGQPVSRVLVLIDEETCEAHQSPIERALQTGAVCGVSSECALRSRDGTTRSIQDSAAPIRDRVGKTVGAVMVFHDVSDARRLAKEVMYHATHDALTGLVNRREFERRLEAIVRNTHPDGRQHALAYLDLDQFKIVNDTCGHFAGDELLRQVTAVLRPVLRATDTLARLGGDEFGVLLETCPPSVARSIAEALRVAVAGLHFVWEERTFPLGVSIGLVNFGGNDHAPTMSQTEILSLADSVCYAAKDLGRNRVQVYRPDDHALTKRHGEMDWHGRLHRAIEGDRLVLYAQPILPLQTPEHGDEHVEILLRLRAEDGKVVLPMAFIPAAERYGLMTEIDRWVVRHALSHIAGLPLGGRSLYSINLSGATLNAEGALAFISEQLRIFDVPPGVVCFEITETAAIANLINAGAFIAALRAKGCKFALDDFGSGMSSFGYLKHLPVDFLKIDGGFVRDMARDSVDAALVAAIHDIGHVMGMRTIAEGVEDDATIAKLRDLGVDYAQGYAVGRPRPLGSRPAH